MAYTSLYKDFIFVEGIIDVDKVLGKIEYEKIFTFNSQSKTLDCVKDQFIEKAKALGGNIIIDFKYGQKTVGWFKSFLFSLDDDIRWYGSGVVATISDKKRKEIIESKKG